MSDNRSLTAAENADGIDQQGSDRQHEEQERLRVIESHHLHTSSNAFFHALQVDYEWTRAPLNRRDSVGL
jgi:hypothetical protein